MLDELGSIYVFKQLFHTQLLIMEYQIKTRFKCAKTQIPSTLFTYINFFLLSKYRFKLIPQKIMIRKVQTRCSKRQNFYHEAQPKSYKKVSNKVIRPPTSHPYSSYKNLRSESQMRTKYTPNFFIDKTMISNLKQSIRADESSRYAGSLPSHLKLYINQIKVFMKYRCKEKKEVNEFEEIVKNIVRNMEEVVSRNRELEIVLETKESKIKQLDEKVNHIEEQIKNKTLEDATIFPYKNTHKKGKNEGDMILKLENCRLTKLNARYLKIISQLQQKKENKIQSDNNHEELQKTHDTELLRCQNRISYLQMKLSNAQKLQAELTVQNQTVKKEVEELRQIIEEKQRKIIDTNEKLNQWREKALMQKQESELNVSRQQFLLFSMKKLRENNKNLIQKLISQNKNSEFAEKSFNFSNPNFQYEHDFFKSLPGMYRASKRKEFKMNLTDKKNQLGLQIEESSFDIDYHNYKKTESFDVSFMKMYRPTFFSFLEESANPDLQNCRSKGNTSVSRIFIQVMRALTISKLNEFLYSSSIQRYSRFPEFVYSWFQKYYFNSEKKYIAALEPFMQKPYNQELFYRDLMNVKLDQSWEIITFREFLLEELCLEELYFYLLCQMLLYTKAGITKETLFIGDFTIFVQYSVAKSVLDIVLSDFQSWNVTFLTSKLRQKIVLRKSTEVIEAGFFLRCLIEYYKIERCNRYRYINKLFSEFENQKKGLRFSSFMTVMGKFTEVPTKTKLQIYRDCYCLTKGVITPESIFLICTENLVFLKYLKIRSFFRMPKISHRPIKFSAISNKEEKKRKFQPICIQPSDPYLYSICIELQKVLRDDGSLIKRLESLGVHDINSSVMSILRIFEDKNIDVDSSFLKCKHFLHFLQNCLQGIKIVNYYNFYELLEEQNKKKNMNFWVDFNENQLGEIFAKQISSVLKVYTEINERRIWKDKIYNFRLHNAAKKIQKMVKKKITEPYIKMFNDICDEIKKQRKQT